LHGRRDLALAPDPKAGFEMTLIRMHAFRPGDTSFTAPASAIKQGPVTAVRGGASSGNSVNLTANKSTEYSTDWQKIIDEMALAGLVRELAGHCILKEHSDKRVLLTLAPAQEHLLKTTQKERLQEAIRTRFGRDVKLVITVGEPESETPAARKQREDQERQAEAVKSFVEDANVKSMLDMFDATLDTDSIRAR
jgi:DNA polymerase-3 subunit gamma/tau